MIRSRMRFRGGNGGGGSPAFSPADIADLELWLDASDSSSIIQVANAVSQWSDKSGNSNHATQGTGANQPTTGSVTINGLNAIDFDGTTDFMVLAAGIYSFSNAETTSFAVFKTNASPADFHTFSLSGGGNRYSIGGSIPDNNYRGWHGIDDGGGTSNVIPQTTNATIGLIHAVGTDFNLYINGGAQVGTTKPVQLFTATGGGIGALFNGNEKLTGNIAEIVAYSGSKSTSEINQVGNYLADKWGISWTDL